MRLLSFCGVQMLSRLLLMVLLVAAAFAAGMAAGANALAPSIDERIRQAEAEGRVSIARSCMANMGFMLIEQPSGKEWIFLCIHAPEGYMLTPEGEPIKPQKPKSNLHRKESKPF